MACILGRKVAMTQTFGPEGEIIPVTVIKAGPCKVIEQRTQDKNGYSAVVVGFEEVEGSKLGSKPLLGFFKKSNTPCYQVLREFRDLDMAPGTDLTTAQFQTGDKLILESVSKGKGMTGVIKKWNYSRGRMSHGGNCQRKIGSIGMHTWPARVLPGKKMAGNMGNEKITLRTIEVVKSLPEENLLFIKGPVPGAPNALVIIRKAPVKVKKTAGTAKKVA